MIDEGGISLCYPPVEKKIGERMGESRQILVMELKVGGGRLRGDSLDFVSETNHGEGLVRSNKVDSLRIAKRKADSTAERLALLRNWGNSKRSRGSRVEQSKKGSPVMKTKQRDEDQQQRRVKMPSFYMQPSFADSIHGKNKVESDLGSKLINHHTGVSTDDARYHEAFDAVGRERDQMETVSPSKIERGLRSAKHYQEADVVATTTMNDNHLQRSGGDNAVTMSVKDGIQHHTNGKTEVGTTEWPRIVLTLSRKEKEEDFLAIKGTSKLPQRPKKRLKLVERALQYITPGNWLLDLAPGRYDVRERKFSKKKRGGLKAMKNSVSPGDSE